MLIWRLIAVTVLISAGAIAAIAQQPTPAPPDKRGLGIETSNAANASQSDQTKAKEENVRGKLDANGLKLRRIVYRWNGRFYYRVR